MSILENIAELYDVFDFELFLYKDDKNKLTANLKRRDITKELVEIYYSSNKIIIVLNIMNFYNKEHQNLPMNEDSI